ncbi:hypothetical protein HALDL1_03730 [Halobacterium sp. DL1]|nr:hypothetical protein HALDL1_03730 [Halobacterium sp. DL1]
MFEIVGDALFDRLFVRIESLLSNDQHREFSDIIFPLDEFLQILFCMIEPRSFCFYW